MDERACEFLPAPSRSCRKVEQSHGGDCATLIFTLTLPAISGTGGFQDRENDEFGDS